jgi:hypothetical protein
VIVTGKTREILEQRGFLDRLKRRKKLLER